MIKRKRYRRIRNREYFPVAPDPQNPEGKVTGISLLKEKIDGVGPWWWLCREGRFETGSWGGPAREWPMLRDKILPMMKSTQRVVTAGGCQGMYPRLWAKHFKEVWAFEPEPENYEVMIKNCEGEVFHLFNAALGEKNEDGHIYYCGPENVGMHSMVRNNGTKKDCKIMTIDSLDLPGVDLIQLDIEGYEPRALKGAEATVAKYRPLIVLETVDGDVTEFLTRHRYDLAGQIVSDRIYRPL